VVRVRLDKDGEFHLALELLDVGGVLRRNFEGQLKMRCGGEGYERRTSSLLFLLVLFGREGLIGLVCPTPHLKHFSGRDLLGQPASQTGPVLAVGVDERSVNKHNTKTA
jgi:hypothetical protein